MSYEEQNYDLMEPQEEGRSNIFVGAVVLGAAVVTGVTTYLFGRGSREKEAKRDAWRSAGTKKKRMQIFGRDEYEFMNEWLGDEEDFEYDEHGEYINDHGRNGTAKAFKNKKKKLKKKH